MRIDVTKYLLVGVNAQRENFFEEAQKAGIIEFIDPTGTKVYETPVAVQQITQAIKVLRGLEPTEQEETQDWERSGQISSEILALYNRQENLLEERRMLRQEVARVEPFGDFSLEDLDFLRREGKRVVQFFAAKQSKGGGISEAPGLVHVASDHGLDYYLSVNAEPVTYDGMMEMRIDKPLGVLQAQQVANERELDEIEAEIDAYAKYNHFLHQALLIELDHHHLDTTKEFVGAEMDEQVFTVECWVPQDQIEVFEEVLEKTGVIAEEVAVESKDRVPTALTNKGISRIGEDLVHIYDTPGTEDADPSAWVLWAFALFFAVILGDGGYGFLFLVLAGFLYWKFPKLSGAGRRVLNLVTILSVSCILWGFLTTNFFGIKFDLGSPIRQFSVVQWMAEKKAEYHMGLKDAVYQEWEDRFSDVEDAESGYQFLEAASETTARGREFLALDKFSDNVMLELALFIGVVHISLSFLRSIRSNWSGLGWIAFMAGAYLYFPSMLNATSMAHYVLGVDKVAGAAAGMQLLYLGIGSAVVLAIIQHKGQGALEIMNLIQVFSDVLSYLRLYALGLAGSMMSATFNQIGAEVTLVAGVVIIIIGHMVNIVLSVMGGVIHGLRLNFLEWYHYCFEGGGKLFNPLRRLGAE